MILSWPLPVLVIVVFSHLGVVLAQGNDNDQCVKVTSINSSDPCPCTEVLFTFSMEGKTSVADNVVNIALVLDGSSSVSPTHFDIEKEFAKNVTAAFAEMSLFDNGGSASYVQFSWGVDDSDTGTFYSQDDFNDFVDANPLIGGATNIYAGIDAARELLNAAPDASDAFMYVVLDGNPDYGYPNISDVADEARADGITLMSIGVGDEVSNETLSQIAGYIDEYVFRVDYFYELEGVVDDLVEASPASCPATNVDLIVTYGATVESTNFPGAIIEGDVVTFPVDDLEDNPTEFAVVLGTCGAAGTFHPVQNTEYIDDQGNSPDFVALLNTAIESCSEGVQPYTDYSDLLTTSLSTKPILEASTKASQPYSDKRKNKDYQRK